MPKWNFSYLPPPADGPVVETSRDSVSGVASSVEDPEGVGDDPSVDPEVGDGPIVGVVFVVVFVLLVELDFDFR